jgi:RHS repeat-associated protein
LNQANGKQTKLYFQRTDTGTTYLLTPQALNASLTSFTLDSQALASPCGQFWGTQFQTGVETGPGPSSDLGSSRPGEQGTQDGCGSPPPPSPSPATKFVNAYRHLDHLGSLRVARGDSGAVEAGVSSALDLYPYGAPFASSVAESSRQFTGHERDTGTGMDYMLARYAGEFQARFLSPDIVDGEPPEPQHWNKFSLLGNDPVIRVDPDGNVDRSTMDMDRRDGIWKNAGGVDKHERIHAAKVLKTTSKVASGVSGSGALVTIIGVLLAQPEVVAVGAGMMTYGSGTAVAASAAAAVVDPSTQNVSSAVVDVAIQATAGKAAKMAGGATDASKALVRGSMELQGYIVNEVLQIGVDAVTKEGAERAAEKSTSGGSPGPCVTTDGKACSPGNTAKEDGSVDLNQ